MTFTAAARILLPLAVLPLLTAQLRFYRTMEIDPGSLAVRFSNELPFRAGFPKEAHFLYWGLYVDHVVPLGPNQPISHPDAFSMSRDLILTHRRKFQEIFSGSFGSIIAESTYYYPGGDYGFPAIHFGVRADSYKIQGEVPRIIDDPPSPTAQLNSITVARILSSEAEDLVAVGTYNPNGELLCVVVDAFKSGKAVPVSRPSSLLTVDDVINYDIRRFGFPVKFSVDEYRLVPNTLYLRAGGSAPFTLVSFHYEHNRWVEQYLFEDAGLNPAKYHLRHLEFLYTDQDQALRLADRTLPWTTANERMFIKVK
jgi:hypothetical protein